MNNWDISKEDMEQMLADKLNEISLKSADDEIEKSSDE